MHSHYLHCPPKFEIQKRLPKFCGIGLYIPKKNCLWLRENEGKLSMRRLRPGWGKTSPSLDLWGINAGEKEPWPDEVNNNSTINGDVHQTRGTLVCKCGGGAQYPRSLNLISLGNQLKWGGVHCRRNTLVSDTHRAQRHSKPKRCSA
jgi:hypothetical protein